MENSKKFDAVVIGGSLGGMDAVIKILSCLPPSIKFTFIIVLHRLKDAKSPLIEIMSGKSNIKVKEADEKEKVMPGYAYIAPANYHLLVEEDATLSLDVSERVNFSRPSIDVTFESAAAAFKNKLVGIVLTGANQDGSKGIKEIARYGGLTIVQDPVDAACPVMPEAAIKSCKVDKILPLNEICDFLVNIARA